MTRELDLVVFLALAAALALLTAEPSGRGPAPEPERSQPSIERRFDAPDETQEWYRLRREPLAGAPSPAEAYRVARRRMAAMRRHSTRAGTMVAGGRWLAAAAGLDAWEPLGPGNIGGRTRALVIDPDRPRTLYAAGVSGGVWRSRNGGRRWEPVGEELANLAVNALAIDPADPSVLYAGTGEGYFREEIRGTGLPLRGGGIFRSADGGESWQRLPRTGGARFHWVNDLAISRHDSERIYAATRKGVLRSLDGGAHWRRVLNPRVLGGCLDLEALAAAPGDALLAACGTFEQATVWRKIDAESAGRWEAVLSDAGMGRTSLAAAPSDPDVVYALAASNEPGPNGRYEQALHAVFRSDRAGEAGSWEARVRNTDSRKINTLLLHNAVVAVLQECGFGSNEYLAMGWYVNMLAVDPRDPERVWAGGVDLFRSDDGGRNWNPASWWWANEGTPGFVHADQHALVFHPRKPGTAYSLNDGGVYRTRNAGAAVPRHDGALCQPGAADVRWTALNNSYGVTQFYHGQPFPGDPARYLGGTQDNGTILGEDGAGPDGWRRVAGGDGSYVAVDPADPQIVYAGYQNGVVIRSLDGGASFQEATTGITDLATNQEDGFRATGPNFLFISPLLLDPGQPGRLWLGGRRLWRTDNRAAAWGPASAPLAGGGKASALAVAPGDPNRVLAGTHVGFVHRSRSAGVESGESEWPGSRPRRGFVTSVAFDPGNSDVAYATYGGFGGDHVWRSDDGGITWAAIDGRGRDGLPDVPAHSLVVDPRDSRTIYLGTDVGVFVSVDGGATWAVENTGFAAVVTETLALTDGPGGRRWLFAFTHGRGAWRVPLPPAGAAP